MFVKAAFAALIAASALLAAPAGALPDLPSARAAAVPIDLDVTAGDGAIWKGSLRIAPGATASYQFTRTEADPAFCPPQNGFGRRAVTTSFSISLSDSGEGSAPVRLSLSWQRPIAGACGSSSVRRVTIEDSVSVPASGGTVEVKGDAGLTVKLSRR